MLGSANVGVSIAVKDLEKAKKFYGETLGLKQLDENQGGVYYQSGDSKLMVYPSEFAGTNKATYAGWEVKDVEAEVAALKEKGVTFNTFDMPGMKWEGDVAVMGDMKAAWFNDPDGNILAIGNM
jgi:catechol 2,3-dioxygenase-like lactoylglutathione lyase family enzyme